MDVRSENAMRCIGEIHLDNKLILGQVMITWLQHIPI